MPEDFERRVVVELDPGLDAERHQLPRLDVGEEEVRSPPLVRRNRHRTEHVSGATRRARLPARTGTLLRRFPTLAEVANFAAFVASDRASAMTGAIANLTCGSLVD